MKGAKGELLHARSQSALTALASLQHTISVAMKQIAVDGEHSWAIH
jgi:hypothetical protein